VIDFAVTSDGSRMLFLRGEFDLATLPLMEGTIAPTVAKGGPITLDLGNLVLRDQTGITVLPHGHAETPSRLPDRSAHPREASVAMLPAMLGRLDPYRPWPHQEWEV
jgi:hypothetical protein